MKDSPKCYLVYALLQFFVQAVITVDYGIAAYGLMYGDLQLAALARSASYYVGFALCFSPPICLFSTRCSSGGLTTNVLTL